MNLILNQLIFILLLSPLIFYNSLRVIDFVNKKETEDKIIDSKIKRLIVSTLTSIFVVCLFLKVGLNFYFIKYFVLIDFLFIAAYIDQHTKNVYIDLCVVFGILSILFILCEFIFFNGDIQGMIISIVGTIILSLILCLIPNGLGWGDFIVFIISSVFLANLSFFNIINIVLSMSLSGFGAIFYIIRYRNLKYRQALIPYILVATFIILILTT